MSQTERGSLGEEEKLLPHCLFCGSTDTMPPFRRGERVFLLTLLFRRPRWRYCRACARHFITFKPRRRTPAAG